jgi:mono/diheme cytochrome c family protein
MKALVGTMLAAGAFVCALTVVHVSGVSQANAAPDGKALFNTNCSSCHQTDGQGVKGSFPPLAGNPDVTAEDPTKIIHIVLHGLDDPITVKGTKYNGGMPAWRSQFSNAEVAAILTYVRSSWGNKASAVTEKQVAAVK